MKKLKKRIKRALANMLRDELLELIGYNPYPSFPQVVDTRGDYGVVKLEVDFDLHNPPSFHTEPHDYERMLESARKKLFKSLEPCIKVETRDLVSPEFYNRRRIRMSLCIKNPDRVNNF